MPDPMRRCSLDGPRLTIADGEASRTIDLGNLDPVLSLRSTAGRSSALRQAQGGVGAHTRMQDLVLEGLGTWDPPTTGLDENGQGVPYATYGFAAQMAEVEVDTALGTVKVLDIVAAHDVGRAINPTLVEGQIHGGIAQGLGLALMEEFIPGRTENLHDYLIPTVGDMPRIKSILIEDPELHGPYGAKGVGEPALIATAPAILSAIRHATRRAHDARAGAAAPPVGSAAGEGGGAMIASAHPASPRKRGEGRGEAAARTPDKRLRLTRTLSRTKRPGEVMPRGASP